MANKIQELIDDANASPDDSSLIREERKFGSGEECTRFFDLVKARMLDIRQWSQRSTPSTFALFDREGGEIDDRAISVGSFIRINIWGSGKPDWVRVTNIYETPAQFVITVQPSFDPTEKPQQRDVVSHFFLPTARNNFCLKRDEDKLTFLVVGTGEKTNTAMADGVLEAARNAAASNLGSYLGLQTGYWKELCTRMLSDEQKD